MEVVHFINHILRGKNKHFYFVSEGLDDCFFGSDWMAVVGTSILFIHDNTQM